MKLSEYLDREKIKPSAFATSLGMPASTITRILNGARKPSFDVVRRISEKTDGVVAIPEDFIPDHAPEGDAA